MSGKLPNLPKTRTEFEARVRAWRDDPDGRQIWEAVGMTQMQYAKYLDNPTAFWERENDIKGLETLLDQTLRPEEETAFSDMLDSLKDGRRLALTDAQRKWMRGVLDRKGVLVEYENLFSNGCAIGKPVETPEVLKHRPLKPPQRPKKDDE